MNTTDILEKTKKLVSTDREDKHGDKVQNHENIARLWTSYLQNKTKLNIIILPEDVANLCVFLGSDNSSYITGQVINICGGMST